MRRLLHLSLFLSIAVLLFPGCAAPKVIVRSGAKLESYRKVYLIKPNPDPRSVNPRVQRRLAQTGFDVIEVTPDGPPIDMQGSGFLITPQGHVLTCAHVVGQETNATIWIEGTRHLCRVVATDTNRDLALLLVEKPSESFHPLLFAVETNYFMGQDAFTMGFPLAEMLGVAPRLNKGLISATVGLRDDPNQVQVSAAVQPGNSGGPLLNARGQVIGVVNATLNPMSVMARSGGDLPQNVNFAVKAGPIRQFLAPFNLTLTDPGTNQPAEAFEAARQSLALVRPGNMSDEDVKRPTLACLFGYHSIFDMWFRFRSFQMVFVDMKTGDWVLKAGQQDDPFSSEDATLDRIFMEIAPKFFPDRAVPAKGK